MDSDPCTLLEWDSAFFGVRIARVNAHTLDERSIRDLERWCTDRNVDCLYFLADLDARSTGLAEESAFHLVDVRVTLHRSVPSSIQTTHLRPLLEADLEVLRGTAESSHTDSRFFSDEHFPRRLCKRLYEVWLERSVQGKLAERAFGLDFNGRPAGYITIGFENHLASIGLVAVQPEARGHGIGTSLVEGALREGAAHGCRGIEVVTQARNISAQRLYQKCGFRTTRVRAWYHRWF